MPRYDEFYDRPGRYDPPSRFLPYRRGRHEQSYERYRTTGRYQEPWEQGDYADDFGEYRPMGAVDERQERMGLHDFSERYGRYSGGSPYSYGYSERTIYHPPRYPGAVGFSRPLGEAHSARGHLGRWPARQPRSGYETARIYGEDFGRRRDREYREPAPGARRRAGRRVGW